MSYRNNEWLALSTSCYAPPSLGGFPFLCRRCGVRHVSRGSVAVWLWTRSRRQSHLDGNESMCVIVAYGIGLMRVTSPAFWIWACSCSFMRLRLRLQISLSIGFRIRLNTDLSIKNVSCAYLANTGFDRCTYNTDLCKGWLDLAILINCSSTNAPGNTKHCAQCRVLSTFKDL
jgi:hypothetical protein